MSRNTSYPLRKQSNQLIPPSFDLAVTNFLSKGRIYEITGMCVKRRQQLGLIQLAKDGKTIAQIQKISGAVNAEELALSRENILSDEIAQIESVWSALSNACAELVDKGLSVSQIISSLNSTKTFVNLYNTHVRKNPLCSREIGAQVKNELRSVEDKLVVEVANKLGVEYADRLSARLAAAWKT